MRGRKRKGFTLIELMVVMGLMVLIGAIVVTGSFGMSRATSYTAAENIVYNTLQMARQRACTDGKRVAVVFVGDEKDTADYADDSFTAIEAVGTVTEPISGNYLQDRCANLAKYTESGRMTTGATSTNTVWNLRTGAKFHGFEVKSDFNSGASYAIPGMGTGNTAHKYGYTVTQITPITGSGFNRGDWRQGDPYGFQIIPAQVLPRGFKIGLDAVGVSPAGKLLVFEPDGTSFLGTPSSTGIQKGAEMVTLHLYEEIFKNDAAKAVQIRISKGIVTVVEQGGH